MPPPSKEGTAMATQRQPDGTLTSASPLPTRVTSTDLTVLMTLSPDALLVVDQAGVIVMANEQCAALFGYAVEQIRGHPLEMLLPSHLLTRHTAHCKHYMAAPRMRSMG